MDKLLLPDELVNSVYNELVKQNPPRVYKKWHASSIAECPRQHYYKRLGVKPTSVITPAKQLRFVVGHMTEAAVRPLLKAIYPDLVSNKRLTSKVLDLTGEYDNYDSKHNQIIEVKSIHVYAYGHLVKQDEAYLTHQWQNHAYALLLAEKEIDVEVISYLYMSLDGRLKAYQTDIEPEILYNVKERIDLLNVCYENNIIPKCVCYEGDEMYKPANQYCDYQGFDECCSLGLVEDLPL